jgi:hypothetical protein
MARYPTQSAKSNDPATWGSFEHAVAAVRSGQADGIGFMLLGSTIGAVDLDHCLHPELPDDQWIDPWAKELWAKIPGAYHEKTVSNTGARIIGVVDTSKPEIGRRFAIDKNGASIEIYRNTARYITISGLQFGKCEKLPPVDDFLDKLLAQHLQVAADAGRSTSTSTGAAAGESVDTAAGASSGGTNGSGSFDFNIVGRQWTADPEKFEHILKYGVPEGQRSEAFQAVGWHLASRGWSAQEIEAEIVKYPAGIGAKYAGRLAEEIERSFLKYRARRHGEATRGPNGGGLGISGARANTGAGGGSGGSVGGSGDWPQIRLVAGELPRIVNEAEDALLKLGREFYRYGDLLVRPSLLEKKAADKRDTLVWQLIPITQPYLRETFACAAQFVRWEGKRKIYVMADVPKEVAEIYLARRGEWKTPILTGIINVPFLRQDGSICETTGYDEASGLLFRPEIEFPSIPLNPTRRDAIEALRYLKGLVKTFPFIGEHDINKPNINRSVHLAGVLTSLSRRLLSSAPLIGFNAPTAGTGKSLLVDIISLIATGREQAVISQSYDIKELEKQLGTALIEGDLAISIDNCNRPLESVFLCQMLTRRNARSGILARAAMSWYQTMRPFLRPGTT